MALICDKAQSVINDAIIDEWCKRIKAYICANGRYFEHYANVDVFCDQKQEVKVIDKKRLTGGQFPG